MKKLIKIFVAIIAMITVGCLAKQSNEFTSSKKGGMIEKEYKVGRNFHYSLARAVNENNRDHRGIKSLLVIAGISFPEDSVATLAAPLSTLYFLNTPEEHHKLELIIDRVSESAGIDRLETENERVLQRKPSQ